MSYSVTCQCGKKLVAKQPVAGRRLRCPACGEIVGAAIKAAAPAPGAAAAIKTAAPAARACALNGPPVVFVSHSAKDKTAAAAICSTLEHQGVRCWIAPRDIVPGKEWGEAIIDGISGCRIMVLIFSGHSNQSPQVRR